MMMKKVNQIIAKRIEAVENGEDLLCFTEEEFDEMNKKLLTGIKPDLSKIRRIKKNEKSKYGLVKNLHADNADASNADKHGLKKGKNPRNLY